MLLLGFCFGLAIGIGFWVWQVVQFNHYLGKLLQSLTHNFKPPLIPRWRHDIALVKYYSEDLQQQLKTYQQLLDFAPLGYLQVDEENQLLWCNQQAQEILDLQRWQPGQVRLLLEVVRSYELDRLIEKTRDRQQVQVREWVFHPSCDNANAMLELRSVALRASGLPLPKGQVGVFLENRQPLLDMNQARDRAFSDLAHELRTPLTSIRLVVETLQDRVDAPLNRWVKRLMLEVDRLINLVQSWLELTQLETNPILQLHRQPVEVQSLIASAWETLEPLAERRQIKIKCSVAKNLWINADESRIYQVFLNLLDNSIKYSPPDTTIEVEAKVLLPKDGDEDKSDVPRLEINIIDSGEGFSESDLPYVFQRFYRGDKARSRNLVTNNSATTIVGSGLGLAIVQQIILAHGGSIKANNHPVTGGAWLAIKLPQVMAKLSSQDYS
jgi:two-component system phosphate regulon sensor histidine kinase PhoR